LSETIEATDQAEVIEEAETASAEIVEESAPSEETTVETAPEDKKNGVQKRIDELTRQRYEEAEARKEAEARIKQYEAQMAELQAKQAQGDLESRKPKIEDFDYDQGRFEEAYSSWLGEVNQRNQEVQQQQAQQQAQYEAQLKRQIEVERKIAEGRVKYPDFDEKVNNPQVPSLAQMNQAAFEALIESEQTADLSYYLANNPSEVYRFQGMSPVKAIKEIAKLESKLQAKPATTTKAPPPPTDISGKAEATSGPPKDINEWMRWRAQQLQG
jgi:hypothetical protein